MRGAHGEKSELRSEVKTVCDCDTNYNLSGCHIYKL